MGAWRLVAGALVGWAVLAGVGAAMAQQKTLGSFESWRVTVVSVGESKRCTAASWARREGWLFGLFGRSRAVLTVNVAAAAGAWRYSLGVVNERPYRAGTVPELRIENRVFRMAAGGNMALATPGHLEATLLKAMREGSAATFVAASARGERIAATFPLAGFAAALAALDKACAVRVRRAL